MRRIVPVCLIFFAAAASFFEMLVQDTRSGWRFRLPDARRARRERAVARKYWKPPVPFGAALLAVPLTIKSDVISFAKGKALHVIRDADAGAPSHSTRAASLAAYQKGVITEAMLKQDDKTRRSENASKHRTTPTQMDNADKFMRRWAGLVPGASWSDAPPDDTIDLAVCGVAVESLCKAPLSDEAIVVSELRAVVRQLESDLAAARLELKELLGGAAVRSAVSCQTVDCDPFLNNVSDINIGLSRRMAVCEATLLGADSAFASSRKDILQDFGEALPQFVDIVKEKVLASVAPLFADAVTHDHLKQLTDALLLSLRDAVGRCSEALCERILVVDSSWKADFTLLDDRLVALGAQLELSRAVRALGGAEVAASAPGCARLAVPYSEDSNLLHGVFPVVSPGFAVRAASAPQSYHDEDDLPPLGPCRVGVRASCDLPPLVGEAVLVDGLKSVQFNGRFGTCVGVDTASGRTNIQFMHDLPPVRILLHHLTINAKCPRCMACLGGRTYCSSCDYGCCDGGLFALARRSVAPAGASFSPSSSSEPWDGGATVSHTREHNR